MLPRKIHGMIIVFVYQKFLIKAYMKYFIKEYLERIFTNSRYVIRKEIKKKLEETNKKLNVLDVGSGDGMYKNLFSQHNYKSQDNFQDKNFSFKDVDFTCSLEDLIEKKLRFNFILCTQVIEHVFDYEDFIKKITLLLEDDGVLFLTTNFMYLEHDSPNDYFRFSKNALKNLIEKKYSESLKIIEVKPLDDIFSLSLDFGVSLPFYFLGDKSFIAKSIIVAISPIILLLRLISWILQPLDKKNYVYSIIFIYIKKVNKPL